LVIGSRTPPVEEVIDGVGNGYLVDFFDTDMLADRICSALEERQTAGDMRESARRTVVEQYDLNTICLPAHLALIGRLMGGDATSGRATPHETAAGSAALSTE
jgi:glycosyltransferase involved in cell wall biosynthesis